MSKALSNIYGQQSVVMETKTVLIAECQVMRYGVREHHTRISSSLDRKQKVLPMSIRPCGLMCLWQPQAVQVLLAVPVSARKELTYLFQN